MPDRKLVFHGVAAIALAVVLSACGITAPRSNDGYANLDSLGIADTDRVMSLSIGPGLLHFAAGFMDDEPETQAMMRSLDGVRVRIYEIDGDLDRVNGRMARMSEKLVDDGWEPVAVVAEDGERTWMMVKGSESRIDGLTVISSDGVEAVVVNVMGNLKPELFTDTMVALDVPAPEVQVAALP
ncbi:DUF4252 domain-containing protein [Marinihelvus fidelis]|uniref:DUF4252 domain-containing protein n=1 Tax=Marinihelvus fidelis TaxID=2613842 RepID=A0A5N0T9Z4_9GAMM|nr:DUF4252 domain-containing protein [Marinihelvus fidelis]KAA9131591.1 DUF4252 domain-containing protein [Marinihelvus fidelis]